MKKSLLVICGPTATGKTSLGLDLAQKLNGEIVSADSRQVYRGMDIGTGKDVAGAPFHISCLISPISNLKLGYYLVEKVPIWLYDLVEPDYPFNVADYVKVARRVIKDIWQRRKLPILVGGTGLYIKALVEGLETLGIPPNQPLRKKLERLSLEKLAKNLKDLDPAKWTRMNQSDRQNPRRLTRAIEIAKKSLSAKGRSSSGRKLAADKILYIGLTASKKFLYQRINTRVKKRVKQGIKKEIKLLLKKGYHWQNSVLGETLGYQEWQSFFKRKETEEEVIQKWQFHEHAYARRQLTWLKKNKQINWLDIEKKDSSKLTFSLADTFGTFA
jgi:tRNA dimethylallyltransferase